MFFDSIHATRRKKRKTNWLRGNISLPVSKIQITLEVPPGTPKITTFSIGVTLERLTNPRHADYLDNSFTYQTDWVCERGERDRDCDRQTEKQRNRKGKRPIDRQTQRPNRNRYKMKPIKTDQDPSFLGVHLRQIWSQISLFWHLTAPQCSVFIWYGIDLYSNKAK